MPPLRTSLAAPEVASVFETIDVTIDGNVTRLRHATDNSYAQLTLLGVSTFLFILFVVSVIPMMRLTLLGNVIWVTVGVVVLGTIGLVSQSRLGVATLRLDEMGIELDHGTMIDREHAAIAWSELLSVELEPVDPKDGRKGMQLRFTPRDAGHVDVFAGLGIGDLNAARRMVLTAWEARRDSR